MVGPLIPYADQTGISVAPADPKQARSIYELITGSRSPIGPAQDNLGLGLGQTDPGNMTGLAPAAKAPGAPTAKDPFADIELGGGGSNEGNANAEQSALDQIAREERIWRTDGMARPAVSVLPEGENYHLAGGREGKKNYNQAYDPDPAVNAIMNAQVAEKDRNEALSQNLISEQARQKEAMAAIMAKRQENAAQMANRQQMLDQAVTRYTDDLSNQNKFWSNPGNIISAIAFSLMPIAGGDPANGARLINQAIEADFGKRLQAANMHLGELRSNIGAYRSMVENQQVGDMLAESEARRIAATDIERISLQFASPISKAKAEAAIADQRMRSAQLKMQAYKVLGIHQDPRVVPKVLGDAIKAGGEDGVGFTPFSGPDVPKGSPAAAAAGGIGPGGSIPTTANTGGNLPGTRIAALAASPDEAVKQAKSGQLDTKNTDAVLHAMFLRRAAAMHPGNPGAIPKQMEEFRAKAQEGVAKIATVVQKPMADVQAVRSLQMKLDYLEKYYREKFPGKSPDEFLQGMRDVSPAFTNTINELRMKYGKDQSDEGKAAKEFLQASQSLYQEFSRARSAEVHNFAGSALTPQEIANLDLVIKQNPSFSSMKNWVGMVSRARQAEIEAALTAGGNPESALLFIARNPGYRQGRLSAMGIPGAGPVGPVEGQKTVIGPY